MFQFYETISRTTFHLNNYNNNHKPCYENDLMKSKSFHYIPFIYEFKNPFIVFIKQMRLY